MSNELEKWFKDIPPVTRFIFTGSMIITLVANFGLISPMTLILDFSAIFQRFEVWRLVTPFLFHGKLGFPFLVNMMFLYRYGALLETEIFRSDTADYLFFVLFGSCILFVVSLFLNMYILGMSLILMIIYYWSKKQPNIPMTFMFGLRFESAYFPWVLIGFRLLMGGLPIAELIGVAVGHIYHFFKDIYPENPQDRYLKTPQFLKNLIGQQPTARPGEGPRQPGYNWGAGYRLN
eukprot:TRINITY_DN4925_c0_g1_i1.p1 TRINITY_DN4925_c0_g1~~TRINITY_DN4925_c0_g1_i1.p1  ORF type:complete len:234 (-),score=34.96 TRINITY_DN4925_c0_g1_i1:23-724(-)